MSRNLLVISSCIFFVSAFFTLNFQLHELTHLATEGDIREYLSSYSLYGLSNYPY